MRIALIPLVAIGAAGVSLPQTINFDSAPAGAPPPDWTVAMTHKGGAPKWEILKDDSAPSRPNVFAQVSTDATGGRVSLAVYQKASLTDGTLSVQITAT